jgi:general secretion pathway protein D
VVPLKNADLTKLATLRAAFAGGVANVGGVAAAVGLQQVTQQPQGAAAGATPATAPLSASAQPSTGGFIQADPASNSLIITAPAPLYRQVRAMIEQLDTRRAQIYIESLIVEVSGDNAADFGSSGRACSASRATNTVCSPAPTPRPAGRASSTSQRPSPGMAPQCPARD